MDTNLGELSQLVQEGRLTGFAEGVKQSLGLSDEEGDGVMSSLKLLPDVNISASEIPEKFSSLIRMDKWL